MIEMTDKTRGVQEAFEQLLNQEQCEFKWTYDPPIQFTPEFDATPNEEKLYFDIQSIGDVAAYLEFVVSVGTGYLSVTCDEGQHRTFTGPNALPEALEFTKEMLSEHISV